MKSLLAFVGLASSTYYYHRSAAGRPDRHARIRGLIATLFESAHRRYGHRRMRLALAGKHGIRMSCKTVLKLMRQADCICLIRRRKYRSYRGTVGRTAPNVLKRDFQADRPNAKWATDVTEFNIAGTKIYLSPVVDLFNGEVISYDLKLSQTMPLIRGMLKEAFKALKDGDKPVLHSDQGWQYQQPDYQRMLQQHGITQSMSRKGNCLDNAVAENFFGHLKTEFFHRQKFHSVADFTAGLHTYIHWYNYDRIRERLNGFSPVQYRLQHQKLQQPAE